MAAQKNPGNSSELLKASAFSGSGKAQGLGAHSAVDPSIATRAREAQKTTGENPGNAPNRGLTQAGVVEKFIDVTLGTGSLSKEAGPLPTAFVPVSTMRVAK